MMKVCVVLACLLASAFANYMVYEVYTSPNCAGVPADIEAYDSGACIFGEAMFTCYADGMINVQGWEQLGLCMDAMNHTSNNITDGACLPYYLDPLNVSVKYRCVDDVTTVAPERLRAQIYGAENCPGNAMVVSWDFTDICLNDWTTNTSETYSCPVNGAFGSRTTCNATMCAEDSCSTLPVPTDFCFFVDDIYVKAFCPSVAMPTTGAMPAGTTGEMIAATTGAAVAATTGAMAAGTTGPAAGTTGAASSAKATTGSEGSSASSVAVSFVLVAALIAALL
jgi:hypothetical protein